MLTHAAIGGSRMLPTAVNSSAVALGQSFDWLGKGAWYVVDFGR